MTIDEAIKALRQHNVKGASVLRITRGQALEKDLLAQVLDSCEKLISEKAEYKRLLKAAVEDIHDILTSQRKITNYTLCCKCSYYLDCTCKDICETKCDLKQWRNAAEALKLIGDEPNV